MPETSAGLQKRIDQANASGALATVTNVFDKEQNQATFEAIKAKLGEYKALYKESIKEPYPVQVTQGFIDLYEKARCYVVQWEKYQAVKKAPISPGRIPLPVETEGAEILDVEDAPAPPVEETPEMPVIIKVALLGFVGYLGLKVLRG